MRVLHVVPTYAPAWRYGGTIRSVHGLCAALAARGHETHVYTTNVDGPRDSAVPLETPVVMDGVRVWYHASPVARRLYWSPGMARRLRAGTGGFDVVHLHSVFLWPTWAGARSSRSAGVPYVLAPRGMMVRDLVRRKSRLAKSAWIALVERRNLERAAGIHVTSDVEAEELRRFGFHLPRVFVVPNGVDAAGGGSVPRRPSVPPFFVFIGRLNWKKGIDRLFRALAAVPSARAVIVGNDEERYRERVLDRVAAEAGVADRVEFTGPLDGEEKKRLLAGASALVLPSLSENFGNVVVEAMAAGCPVVVTPEVGVAASVARWGAGIVTPGDPDALAGALNRVLADPAAAERMGESGRRAARGEFSWDAVASRMEAVYAEVRR